MEQNMFRQGGKNKELIYLDRIVPLRSADPTSHTPGVKYGPSGFGELALIVHARSLSPELAAAFSQRVCDALNDVCWQCPTGCVDCPGLRSSCECYGHPTAGNVIAAQLWRWAGR